MRLFAKLDWEKVGSIMAKKRAKLHSATRARQSFRDFVTRLRSSNPPVIRFKEHARSADFPGAEDWGEIRLHLIREESNMMSLSARVWLGESFA